MAGLGQQDGGLQYCQPDIGRKDINEEMKKEKCENYYYYSKAQIDRNRIIEIIAKSRKPLYEFEIKELIDKVWPTSRKGGRAKKSIEMVKERVGVHI
jgi:hypothetical protein